MELNKGNYKIRVETPEVSEKVQKVLSKRGCCWAGNDIIPQHLDKKSLFIENGSLSYALDEDGSYIRDHYAAELLIKDILKEDKPKAPTHVVIWEEDSDPAKLFTSEKEAKDFIKKLSDKSNVQKDSILLLEVKSCQKVNVCKSLRYTKHKI